VIFWADAGKDQLVNGSVKMSAEPDNYTTRTDMKVRLIIIYAEPRNTTIDL